LREAQAGDKVPSMDQDPRQSRQFAEARSAAEAPASGDEPGLDRIVTAIAFAATVAIILLSPLAI
jgi:hypothetical protein